MTESTLQRRFKKREVADCPEFLFAYLRYIEVFQNRSPLTVDSAFQTIREFLQFVHFQHKFGRLPPTADAHKDMSISCMQLDEVAAFTRSAINEYFGFLDTVVHNSDATIQKKSSILRTFYQYLFDQRMELQIQLSENPVPEYKPLNRSQTLNLLPPQHVEKFLRAIAGPNMSRDYAIFLLILTSGLSVSEVSELNLGDLKEDTITIRSKPVRTLQLTPSCRAAIEEYLADYRLPIEDMLYDKKALFVSLTKRRRTTPRGIQHALRKYMHTAGLDEFRYTAQDMRDTAVVALLKNLPSCDQLLMLDYLGYRNPSAIRRFTAVLPAASPAERSRELILNSSLANIQ